jgi:sulfur carrier protein
MSIEVFVNGERRELRLGATVSDLVEILPGAPGGRGVAVAVDGEVVRRGAWSSTELAAGARVEVVAAVQGG